MIKEMMHFWSEERSLTTLLVLLAISMFIIEPVVREGAKLDIISGVFFSLVLLAGLLTMTRQRAVQSVFVLLVALTMTVHWMRIVLDTEGLRVWDSLLSLLAMLALTTVVLMHVNRAGPVTGHRVRGAVAGYLLLGVCFACAYSLIDSVIPEAFQMAAADLRSGQAQSDAFVYFSVVTLTTLGYGDITAVHPVARSVVMAEALLGQLYPAILIARLVTLQMATRKNKAA